MSTIADLAGDTQERLRDTQAVFWNLQAEVFPAVQEAMNEACLITGEPEVGTVLYDVTANETLQPMPVGAVAIVRVQGAGGLATSKATPWDLDRAVPGWENDTDVSLGGPDQLLYWFPFGLTQFGVYPKMVSGAQVVLTYVALPVQTGVPLTGAEPVPFQGEYNEGLSDGATHFLRLKEGGAEFRESVMQYQRFLTRMGELSDFAARKGSLRFARALGLPAATTPKEVS